MTMTQTAVKASPGRVQRGFTVLLVAGSLGIALCALWFGSTPGGSGFLILGVIPLLPLAVLIWGYLFLKHSARERRIARSVRRVWTGGILVMACLLLLADVPFRARFELSRPALDALAATYIGTDRPPTEKAESMRLFSGRSEPIGPGTFLLDVDLGVFGDCGLLFTTTDDDFPQSIHGEQILYKERLTSHWWRVCYSW